MTPSGAAPIDPRRWLAETTRPLPGRDGQAAGLLAIADAAPAVAFAAGLAGAIAHLPEGLVAILPWLALAVVALAARGLLAWMTAATGARAAGSVKDGLRRRLLFALFDGRAGPGGLSAVVEGVEALDGHVSRFEPARRAAVIAPLLIIAAAAFASPVAAGVMLFTLLPFALGMGLAGVAAARESRRQFQALERLSGLFLDRIRALPALLAFQAQDRAAARLATASDDLERRTARVLRVAFLSSAVLEFFSALSVALVAVYCGFNLLRLLPFPVPEQLDLARAFFVLALAPEVYAPMRRLAAAYHDRQAAEAAAPSLAAALNTAAPVRVGLAPVLTRAPAIRFRAVSIAYRPDTPVIAGFDLAIPPGGLVALTGPSGSGKSSLLHLLLGLAPLTDGKVMIDDLRLSQTGPLAGVVAWAGQAPVVVPGTLADNIALAWREASSHQVVQAAVLAGLSGDLSRPIDERGGGLSGGERRRLGLARALLKPAPILLLDEPTANLDAASEAALLPVIRRAAQGRTTLIATHSPAVMALADTVVTL
ncbi:MAG: thiol reductant ABC exporter subunit CydD [Brevundimonas sp.]|uniref:thiol reductant ABC exporter subunit CydD n=1 Tax=Brevundimonas sp. TaxID=1871086 RepID=UPI0011FCF407|nr:thiol reductant ABC exporter subunit CydD [Brevundimonas sp.]RZJ19574.1 MAG: thiol reductant ABC exporter subunit CydD [Brevundimonas sp.]